MNYVKKIKRPKHSPYPSPKKQYETFKLMVEKTTMSIWQFERSMKVLVSARFISKSQMHKWVKWFRQIKNIPYEVYKNR